MKKVLLILGIVLLTAAVLCFLISGFHRFVLLNTQDASGAFYTSHSRLTKTFLISGIAAAVPGLVSLLIWRFR